MAIPCNGKAPTQPGWASKNHDLHNPPPGQLGRDECIYRLEKEGEFPQRKQLGKRMTGWIDDEVTHWLEHLPNGGCAEPTHATAAHHKR